MKKVMSILIFSIICLFILGISFFVVLRERNTIKNIYIDNNDKIIIELDDKNITYCSLGNKTNTKWIKSNSNQCVLDYSEDNNYVFLKNKYNVITKIKNKYNLSSIKEFNIKNNKIYLAIGGTEKIDYYLDSIIDKKEKIIFKSADDNIAIVDNNGIVTGKNVGNTTISLMLENYNIVVNVIVTDKIILPTADYDYKKEYIKCNEYTKEENDLIDEILASRISRVGKSTRAAVVEAARFMTMEFPKRIPYFGENGRLSYEDKAAIDAEGRYYREGMFLNDSRYKLISKSMYGPATWGCKIYSYPNGRTIPNGLDCSGFVAWAFINAGFDVGDIGAGITPVKDFTDLGERKDIIKSINNNSIVVGDLLSGSGASGGHIAILSGIHDGHYYVAESLYSDSHTYYGVVNRKYAFNDLKYYFTWHIDMKDFYKNEGNVTNYWLN